MPRICVVRNCRESRSITNGVTLHRFPKDPDILKVWIEQIIQFSDPVQIKKASCICSRHFEESCFRTKLNGHRFLLRNAVPTIFNDGGWVSRNKELVERFSVNYSSERVGQNIICSEESRKRKFFVGDYTLEDMNNAADARKFFTLVREDRRKNIRKIRVLKMRNDRLQRKLESITGIKKCSKSAVDNLKKMSDFTIPNDSPVKLLDCENAFSGLTDKEKLYAHYLSKASFYGGLITLPQTSLESSLIFVLLHKLFKAQPINKLKQIALEECKFTEDEFIAVLAYAAGIFTNMGNYKGAGDTKFIPNLSKEKFKALLNKSKAAELEPEKMRSLISKCIDPMFSLEDSEKQLGFPYIGKTAYLSKNFTKEDQDIVKEFFKKQGLEPTNTRLIKTVDDTGATCYEIRLASVLQTEDAEEKDLVSTHAVNGHKFFVTRGDYSRILKIVNTNLQLAKEYASNENEVKMLENYIYSFYSGSVDGHKEGSRYWIRNKGPVIENYIGFIETYRDPSGMRAEFEGFVALVNKEMSVKFTNLVNAATDILPRFPWPAEYEKDTFLCPDFTSLDVLTFAGSMIPAGICIPNYQDIRQYEGFKNVSLGNVISSRSLKNANFLGKDDQELLEKYWVEAFEVNVGLHELLGHGCGKLFEKNKDGTLNFDVDKVKHLETGEKITKFYENGETFDSLFGALSSPYEECKAECAALYLGLESDIMKIFGHEGETAERVMHCLWLQMLHKGIEALKMYEPKTNSWLQAHAQARYVILQVCLEGGEGLVDIEKVKGADGNPDLLLHINYDEIRFAGKKAIGNFLRKLQVYKTTADVSAAKIMFEKYSVVTAEDKYPFLNYREIVMARKKPADMFAQANTVAENGKVHLLSYESSFEGLIQSWVDRFQEENVDDILEEIWEKDRLHF